MAKRFGVDGSEPEWGLYVDEQRRDLSARKSLKVKLPIRQHIRLHALKLFSENNISQTVEAALDLYFAQMRAEEQAARLAVQESTGDAGGSPGAEAGPPAAGGTPGPSPPLGPGGPGAA